MYLARVDFLGLAAVGRQVELETEEVDVDGDESSEVGKLRAIARVSYSSHARAGRENERTPVLGPIEVCSQMLGCPFDCRLGRVLKSRLSNHCPASTWWSQHMELTQ